MRLRFIILTITSALVMTPATLFSQFRFQDSDPTGTILPVLERQVRQKYGPQFNVYFVVLDSMIGNPPIEDHQEVITDPYGTLKGTVFFWATPEETDPENQDSVAVGFFKNGSIIWSTPPTYRGGGITKIYASLDLNKDGEVDLITLWSPSSTYNHSTEIWIFSWSGKVGKLISDYDPDIRETKLMTSGSMLKFIRTRNGTYDLKAYWTEQEDMKNSFPSDPIPSRPWVTYRWNGSKYVLDSSVTK